jgi:hypothetical protein
MWQEKFEDIKGVIRIHQSKKDRQHNGQKDKEELEDTKEVIRIRISKKNNIMAKRKRRKGQTTMYKIYT